MTKFLLNQSKFISILMFGMMAGFFATYSFNVNYAMLQVDGATYATVQSLFNINVRHLGFFLCFFGAAVAPLITSLLLFINAERRKALIWAVLSLLYILGIIVLLYLQNLLICRLIITPNLGTQNTCRTTGKKYVITGTKPTFTARG